MTTDKKVFNIDWEVSLCQIKLAITDEFKLKISHDTVLLTLSLAWNT